MTQGPLSNRRKEAIQRTIAAMTLGKDVSALFPDIIKNLATHDLDQKKLVYLYLINYAKTHPELVILAVNTFVQDSEDPNPLVRALAIRTMGCIRVDKMVDYISLPLHKTLKDDNPYVRKTAAICVAKLFDLNPQLAIDEGFLSELQALVDDANPMVVANAVSALMEIQETAPETKCFKVNSATLTKLLAALNECTEWGRISILTALSEYSTKDAPSEAEHICERVVPQFQHANPSVVLAAVQVVIAHMGMLPQDEQQVLLRKMSSPLVSLVSSANEVQYVALRNIRIILQRYPSILHRELRVFFCRYNDPLYLKFEKLEIMVNLATPDNVDQLVAELKEYAHEVDMEFVRRAIRAIGQCAIKIEASAEKCVNVLLDLLEGKQNYVVQEVIVVMRDILRKYRRFEGALPVLCGSIEEIDEPESQAAMVWILGEYAERIDNVGEILKGYVDSFLEEPSQVQLQILTACVKLYIKKPSGGENLIHTVLQTATTKCDTADIRDRAYIYWRLLSSDTAVAKDVVLAEKPPIETTINQLPASVLAELLGELSTLASVYHKPAASFMGSGRFGSDAVQLRALEEQRQLAKEDAVSAPGGANAETLLDLEFDGGTDNTSPAGTSQASPSASLGDLSDIFAAAAPSAPSGNGTAKPAGNQDIMSLFGATSNQPAPAPAQAAPAPSNDPLAAFDGLNLGSSAPAPAQPQANGKKPDDDLIGLF